MASLSPKTRQALVNPPKKDPKQVQALRSGWRPDASPSSSSSSASSASSSTPMMTIPHKKSSLSAAHKAQMNHKFNHIFNNVQQHTQSEIDNFRNAMSSHPDFSFPNNPQQQQRQQQTPRRPSRLPTGPIFQDAPADADVDDANVDEEDVVQGSFTEKQREGFKDFTKNLHDMTTSLTNTISFTHNSVKNIREQTQTDQERQQIWAHSETPIHNILSTTLSTQLHLKKYYDTLKTHKISEKWVGSGLPLSLRDHLRETRIYQEQKVSIPREVDLYQNASSLTKPSGFQLQFPPMLQIYQIYVEDAKVIYALALLGDTQLLPSQACLLRFLSPQDPDPQFSKFSLLLHTPTFTSTPTAATTTTMPMIPISQSSHIDYSSDPVQMMDISDVKRQQLAILYTVTSFAASHQDLDRRSASEMSSSSSETATSSKPTHQKAVRSFVKIFDKTSLKFTSSTAFSLQVNQHDIQQAHCMCWNDSQQVIHILITTIDSSFQFSHCVTTLSLSGHILSTVQIPNTDHQIPAKILLWNAPSQKLSLLLNTTQDKKDKNETVVMAIDSKQQQLTIESRKTLESIGNAVYYQLVIHDKMMLWMEMDVFRTTTIHVIVDGKFSHTFYQPLKQVKIEWGTVVDDKWVVLVGHQQLFNDISSCKIIYFEIKDLMKQSVGVVASSSSSSSSASAAAAAAALSTTTVQDLNLSIPHSYSSALTCAMYQEKLTSGSTSLILLSGWKQCTKDYKSKASFFLMMQLV